MTDLPYVEFGNSDSLRVGDWVLAIGSPFGLEFSAAAGIVSAKGRSVPGRSTYNYMSFINQFRPCPAFIFVLAVALSMPVAVVLAHVFVPSGDIWQHLSSTVLPDYIRNSLLLMLGVAIGTLLIGVTAAWLTTMCQFPGRSVFEWALLLPMAMPAYIIAYTYTGMLDLSLIHI